VAERRPGGLTRRPDFGTTAEDRLIGAPAVPVPEAAPRSRGEAGGARGALGALEPGPAPAPRRRPLKVHEDLADQLREAVLFLRGHGRPELTQNELLDEIIQQGLDRIRNERNDGRPFPGSPRGAGALRGR
jgi:hypothetical protein